MSNSGINLMAVYRIRIASWWETNLFELLIAKNQRNRTDLAGKSYMEGKYQNASYKNRV
jgi:hypothetical protein